MKYFHGVNLPTEPDTSMGQDLSQFPYTLALMGKNNSGELVYTLCLTSKPFCFNPTTQSFEVKAPFELLLQVYYPTENVWVQMPQDSTTSEEDLVFNLALFWNDEILEYATDVSFLVGTNHDIVNTKTGEVAFMVCDDVLLPSIPSNIDRSLYPYAYVVKMQRIESANYFEYMLIVTDKPMQTNSDGTNVAVAGTKGYVGNVDVYAESHCEWIGEEIEITSDMTVEQDGYTMTLIWSEVAEEKMYAIKESTLKNIGNSIRTKTGKTDLITPENMPSEIDGISSGGGAELNIHYGNTAPDDTSKLWVKCAEPSSVLVSPNYLVGEEVLENEITTIPNESCKIGVGVVGTKIYLLGGYVAGTYDYYNTIQVFDTKTETLTTLSITLPFTGALLSATIGTKIYIVDVTNKNIYLFDTETETITNTGISWSVGTTAMGVGVVGTKVYLFGGYKGSTWLDTIYLFNTETGNITKLSATLPYTMVNMGVGVVGTKIYLFGGSKSNTNWYNKIHIFDTETETLTTLDTVIPADALSCMGVGVIGTKIYLFGGYWETTYFNTIHEFDTETETITTLEKTLLTVNENVGVGVVGTKVYLFGGYDSANGNNLNRIDKFAIQMDLASGKFLLQSSLTENLFNILNGDITMKMGVTGVYLGDSDNVGEQVEALLYKNGAWTQI